MSNAIPNGSTPTPGASFNTPTLGLSQLSGPTPFYFLSPDALMAYAEQELRHIDRGVMKSMDEIRSKNKLADKMSSATTFLEKMETKAGAETSSDYMGQVFGIKGGKVASEANNNAVTSKDQLDTPWDVDVKAAHDASMAQLKEAAAELRDAGFHAEANDLDQVIADLDIGLMGNDTKAKIKDALTSLKNVGTTLTRSNDLTMMNLQQSMQRRSRTLTFVSNALKSMDAPQDQAVRNMV